MTIGFTFFHIQIYVSEFGLNLSFLFWVCDFSVPVSFLTTTCPFENSKIKESQFFARRMWLLNSFISKVSGYHHLTQRKSSLCKQIWFTKDVLPKMLWMGWDRLHYFSGDEAKQHADFFTFTRDFRIM